ncbi:MAG: Fe-S cluster assembly ATPase SufC [Patescibacteria group bacterium]
MNNHLKIIALKVARDGKEIIRGVDLEIAPGDVVALMGPNGSGKSTLAGALMGHPDCVITAGKILIDGEDMTDKSPDKRAKAGLFLSMQSPPEIPGLTVTSFLRAAFNEIHDEQIRPLDFRHSLQEKADLLKMNPELLSRGLNEGFSGGERKKSEILQLMVLAPKYAILDETDSGLDVDALKAVGEGINTARGDADEGLGILVITHHQKLLEYLQPTRVIILRDGLIEKEGGPDLAQEIERSGFES